MAKYYKVGEVIQIKGYPCIVTRHVTCRNLCVKCAWFCKESCIAPVDDGWCPLPVYCYARRVKGGV